MSAPEPPNSLLTFGPMIDSELSRFLIWRYGVKAREERHLFGWASVLAFVRAGTLQIPVLTGPGLRLVGPRAIVDHYETFCAPEQVLLPTRQPLRSAIEADWQRFNGRLATETAKFAYFHLLPRPDLLVEPFSRGVPPLEAKLTPSVYPLLRAAFRVLLQLSPGAADDASRRIRIAVDDVDRRLSDGRPFLHGETATLADLALATAIAPFVLPSFYTAPLPPFDAMPEPLKSTVVDMRARPTGAFVERLYLWRQGTA